MKILFEDLMQAGGSWRAKIADPRTLNPFNPDNQSKDPADYYVPIPERDRIKFPGAMIEAHVERDFREFLDQYNYRWRTFSDITRSALYLFHTTVVATHATSEAFRRVKIAARMRKMSIDLEEEEFDKRVIKDAEKCWQLAEKKKSESTRNQIRADLRMYGEELYEEWRRDRFWELVGESAVIGEGVTRMERLAPPREEPPPEEIESDPALDALARGDDGE